MIKMRCFGRSADNALTELPAAATSDPAEACIWIDVEDFQHDELVSWFQSLGFSPRAVRAAAMLKGRTRVVSFDEEVFFEMPALASDASSARVPIAFLCRTDLCVTIHATAVEGLARTANQLTREAVPVGADTSSLVAALLAGLSLRVVDAVDELRRHVLATQDQMDREPELVSATDLQNQSHLTRTLDSVVGERMVVLDRLRQLESPTLRLADNRDFRSAVSDTQYLGRTIDRLEKRVADVRVRYAANQQDRTNRRLAVLTVLSAVFLPLTLIAGIYGMNFEFMPELAYHFAYPAVMGFMAAVAIGMIVFFRSRGWFD